MSYFYNPSNSRSFTVPGFPPRVDATIHIPPRAFLKPRVIPKWPAPETGPITKLTLRRRVDWVDDMRAMQKKEKGRVFTPRTMELMEYLRKTAMRALQLVGRKGKKEIQEEISVLDGALASRHDLFHEKDGLVQSLFDTWDTLVETRIFLEYGDYLALILPDYKGQPSQNLPWHKARQDWITIDDFLNEEEARLKQNKNANAPYTEALKQKANEKGRDYNLVRYQVSTYAQRNRIAHVGLRDLIDHARWAAVAQRILADRDAIQVIFRDRPDAPEKQYLLDSIKIVQDYWYDYLKWDRGNLLPYYEPNERALRKARQLREGATA